MATNPVYQYLDDLGVQELINVVTDMIQENIDEIIVKEIPSDENDDVALSSKAALTFIESISQLIDSVNNNTIEKSKNDIQHLRREVTDSAISLTHLTISFVTGRIGTVSSPKHDVLYFQRSSEDTDVWNLYIYNMNNKWIWVGESNYEMEKYWSKDEIDDWSKRFYDISIRKLTFSEIKKAIKHAAINTGILDQSYAD